MVEEVFRRQQDTFRSGKTRSETWRRGQLDALEALVVDNEPAIFDALYADFSKAPVESWLTETQFLRMELRHARKHLSSWMKPRRVATPLFLQPGRSEVHREPLGCNLIIAPWNYPVQLLLAPLIPAVAAGNCVVLKPSELTPHVSALIAELVPRYLDGEAIAVVEGGVETSQALLEQPWDHIFFTGSTRVGAIVMSAAARHLSRVTLELGGKSPCIVTDDADVEVAARRIVWGKFINAGQTCVAPDYVLASPGVEEPLLAAMKSTVTRFYGEDPRRSDLYPRMINDSHFQRVSAFVDDGERVCGGETDAGERYIAPTILRNVAPQAPVMQEEIFGPVLPVIRVDGVDEAIRFVNDRSQPLSLYVFAASEAAQRVTEQTRAGGGCINDTLVHLGVEELPFGGVGQSGVGKYHGRFGFEAFSNARAVLNRRARPDPWLRYPPYTKLKQRLLGWLM